MRMLLSCMQSAALPDVRKTDLALLRAGPVAMALESISFHLVGDHDNHVYAILMYHLPEAGFTREVGERKGDETHELRTRVMQSQSDRPRCLL
jgi:hypothetical protein